MASSSSSSASLSQAYQALAKAHEHSQASGANGLGDADAEAAVGKALSGIKLQLAKSGLLFPSAQADKADLQIARSTLEIGAFHSLRVKDITAFERYMAQLGVFYRDLANTLPPSPSRAPLTGLRLLALLASGRTSEFHILLEALAAEESADGQQGQGALLKDEFVLWPVDLERWLMEGSYTKVWRARERVPRPEYGVLLDGLVGTIRNEIAQCHEQAYNSLPLDDATRLLFFTTSSETTAFGQKRGWTFSPVNKTFTFPNAATASTTTTGAGGMAESGGRDGMIRTALHYANELEAIV